MFRVLDGGAWTAGRPHVLDGSWVPAKRLWVLLESPIPADPPILEWVMVGDWSPPETTVPSPFVEMGQQVNPPLVRAGWTPVGDPQDPRYGYQVYAEIVVNGVPTYDQTLPQTAGYTDFFQVAGGDLVYALVRYQNQYGIGPATQTGTIVIDI